MYNFSVIRDLRKRASWTIADLSEKTGISSAVISKLERNQTAAELGTIYRLARAFGVTASELLSLVETRTAQVQRETVREVGDFHFRQIEFANSRCFFAEAPKGARRSSADAHCDDYETLWVLAGKVLVELPYEKHVLEAGDSIQFDALFEHSYEVLEDCRIVIQHIRKPKRF